MTYTEKTTKILALANKEVPLLLFLKKHGYINNSITLGMFEEFIPSEKIVETEEKDFPVLVTEFKFLLRKSIDAGLDAILPKRKEKEKSPKTPQPE